MSPDGTEPKLTSGALVAGVTIAIFLFALAVVVAFIAEVGVTATVLLGLLAGAVVVAFIVAFILARGG